MNTVAGFHNIDRKKDQSDKTIALVGNSLAGKQVIKNAFIGLNQKDKEHYRVVDLPSIHTFLEHSAEEKTVRDFICFGGADVVLVVCEAVCLERSLTLALQTMEMTSHVVVCVNRIEEARKKHILIDCSQLEKSLGVPVVTVDARLEKGIPLFMEQIIETEKKERKIPPPAVRYIRPIEKAISILEPAVKMQIGGILNSRWVVLKLLENDAGFSAELLPYINRDLLSDSALSQKAAEAQKYLADCGILGDVLHDNIASCIMLKAEGICNDCVLYKKGS
jgi:ferrous iron transport protein B